MIGNQAAQQAVKQVAAQQPGLFARIKESMRLDVLTQKLKQSKGVFIDIALYGGIGFLSGFLLRKYSAYVAVLILMIVGVILLHQFEVVSIAVNWPKVNELFGIQQGSASVGDTALMVIWEWVKINLVIVVSYIIGFLVGLRFG